MVGIGPGREAEIRRFAMDNRRELTPSFDEQTINNLAEKMKPLIEQKLEGLDKFNPMLGSKDRFNLDYLREVEAMRSRGGDKVLNFYMTVRGVFEGTLLDKYKDVDIYYEGEELDEMRLEEENAFKKSAQLLALIRRGDVNDANELAVAKRALDMIDGQKEAEPIAA